jgi:hypothetical protein
MNKEQSWPVPSWAAKYNMSDNAAICFDKFACRGQPSLSILNVDDVARLNAFWHTVAVEGTSIGKETVEAILLNEYGYSQDDAKYIVNYK